MVWLGIGVLAASISYLLYRYPLTPWISIRSSLPGIKGEEEEKREKEREKEKKKKQRENDTPARNDDWTQKEPVSSVPESANGDKKRPPDSSKKSFEPPHDNGFLRKDVTPAIVVQTTSVDRYPSSNVPPKSQEKSQTLNDDFPLTIQQPLPSTTTTNKTMSSSSTSMPPPPIPRLKPPTMSAPPRPTTASSSSTLRTPPSTASTLRVPPTQRLQNASLAPVPAPVPASSTRPFSHNSPQTAVTTTTKPSRKVILKPGHSPLDWAALKSSPQNQPLLRGRNLPDHYIKVPPSLLKRQNGRKGRDAWTVWHGRVYNITPYLPFHPGGEGELMRAAGREAGPLFLEVHPWVNWEGLLGECLVGMLVSEGEEEGEGQGGELDEMD